jgi:phosphate transport system ATP-binding protein
MGAVTASGVSADAAAPIIEARGFNLFYGPFQALHDVSLEIRPRQITAIIGPSGCGKSSFLRSINRMNDRIPGVRTEGTLRFEERDVYDPQTDPILLRRRVGMVFQKPTPFPMSVFDNVAFAPRMHGVRSPGELDRLVRESLQAASLWDEVKDKLHAPAQALSGGQQQRLCIARTLAVRPEVILMDEPTSALDPAATARIEDLLRRLAADYTIVIVTHNMQQAARVSDVTAFFLKGSLIEFGPTSEVFQNPRDRRTEDYITGRFG